MTAKKYGTAIFTRHSIEQLTVVPGVSIKLHSDIKGDGHTSTKQGTGYAVLAKAIPRSGVKFAFVLRLTVMIATFDATTM
jgi:hypothetical protein